MSKPDAKSFPETLMSKPQVTKRGGGTSRGGQTKPFQPRQQFSRSGGEKALLSSIRRLERKVLAQRRKLDQLRVVSVPGGGVSPRAQSAPLPGPLKTSRPRLKPSELVKGNPGGTSTTQTVSVPPRKQRLTRSSLKSRPEVRRSIPKGARSVVVKPSVSTQTQSTVTDAGKKVPLRKLPKVDSCSMEATLAANRQEVNPEDPECEKPLFINSYMTVSKAHIRCGGRDLQSRNPKFPVLGSRPGKVLPVVVQPTAKKARVSEELYGYLIYEFVFKPRTPECLERMATKARQYLNDKCVEQYTYDELHDLVVTAVAQAMNIPISEAKVRDCLTDYDDSQLRVAHSKMVREGELGLAAVKPGWPFNACYAGSKRVSLPTK